MNVLITGGAGFIGSHLSNELLWRGHRVRAFDLVASDVHGQDCEQPEYLNAGVEFIRGDVRDGPTLRRALDRAGDIRHCFADIALARQVLGYEPAVTLEDGLTELAEWLSDRKAEERAAEAGRGLAIPGVGGLTR
jgi:nucleoside-diphosphate-sugar epimerase